MVKPTKLKSFKRFFKWLFQEEKTLQHYAVWFIIATILLLFWWIGEGMPIGVEATK